MKETMEAISKTIAQNNDNAARYRLQGTEFDLKMAEKCDASTASLQEQLEAIASLENEGGIAP